MAALHPTAGAAGDPTTRRDDANARLSRNWGLVLLRGLLAIAFGAITLLSPAATIASLALLLAAYLLVDGVFAILSGVRAAKRHERWGWFVAEGLANLAAGVAAFAWPGITLLVLVLLSAVWALVSGGAMLGAALRLARERGRGWLAFAGLVSIGWGVLLMVAPVAGLLAMTLWLGAYALAFGVSLVLFAFKLRRSAPPARAA